MCQFDEARRSDDSTPAFNVVKGTEATAAPAFFIVAAWVRAEKHAARLQCGAQFTKNSWQFLPGNVEQAGIGEHAVEMCIGKPQVKEILLPYFTAAAGACHAGEAFDTIQADSNMSEGGEGLQVAPWTATEIENREG